MVKKIIFIILGVFTIAMCFISIINRNFFNIMLLPGGMLFLVIGLKVKGRKQPDKFKGQLYKLKLYMRGKSDADIEHRLAKYSVFGVPLF